jgi:hypothetical protein
MITLEKALKCNGMVVVKVAESEVDRLELGT